MKPNKKPVLSEREPAVASDDFDGITTDQLVKGNPDVAAAVQGAGRELAAALRPTGNDGCQPCPPDVVAAGAPSSIDRLAQADAMKERLNTGTVAAQLATLGGGGGNDLRMLLGSGPDKSFGSQFADYPSYKGFDFTRLASVSDMQADAAGANAHILGMQMGAGVRML